MENIGCNDPKLQPYLWYNYLEKLNDNKKVVHIKKVKNKRFHLQGKYCILTCSVWIVWNDFYDKFCKKFFFEVFQN